MGQQKKSAGPILSADQIIGADDLARETVPVPEWGGDVVVSALSVRALNACQRKATVAGVVDPEKMTVQMVIEGMVEPKMSDDQAGQMADKSAAVMNRIGARILVLSGVDPQTIEAAEARFSPGTE